MIRLNRMTDYAIVVLGALAHKRDETVATALLAELTGLKQPTVAKVAKNLVAADLLVTQRGVNGGYRLVRPARSISLVDIVEAMEGPIAVTDCVDGAPDPCAVTHCCFMANNWNRVNLAIRGALEAVTLEDLTDPAQLFPVRMSADQMADDDPQDNNASYVERMN
ncbi:SUF system Fe-S cluster assembly regulator [Candidatus Puniceispirillum marinum]|uniref:Transcriptional regulator, BadM/Rrf2 family n=1 Tax=Puniceispirillum marinum (strain IMCC1322) TaxID=488538 RepID=D5BNI9_PUNMI|nr:SUF system Fe-S cluster assembly regulator [Candidatus Puniceispirillum marinum]ADE38256.1 transcriptional regulator, BadM/Rrf2 family [Candidatus Puniceispirillum marinum IMCC1322]